MFTVLKELACPDRDILLPSSWYNKAPSTREARYRRFMLPLSCNSFYANPTRRRQPRRTPSVGSLLLTTGLRLKNRMPKRGSKLQRATPYLVKKWERKVPHTFRVMSSCRPEPGSHVYGAWPLGLTLVLPEDPFRAIELIAAKGRIFSSRGLHLDAEEVERLERTANRFLTLCKRDRAKGLLLHCIHIELQNSIDLRVSVLTEQPDLFACTSTAPLAAGKLRMLNGRWKTLEHLPTGSPQATSGGQAMMENVAQCWKSSPPVLPPPHSSSYLTQLPCGSNSKEDIDHLLARECLLSPTSPPVTSTWE